MEGVLNQRYHGHHGGQDGHCIIMTMMQTIAIHSHTYHCFGPMSIVFVMRIDSPATCMNHLDAFHRAQSAQPDAGSVLLSSPTTRNVVLAITYTSIPNTCHQVRGLLTSQENCHLEVLIIVLHAKVYVSIKLSPTKLKIHLCRTGPALGFTSTLGRYETLHRPNSRKN